MAATQGTARNRNPKPETRRETGAARHMASRPRLQLEFTSEAYHRLGELKQLTGARTNAEVIRKALHVFDWIIARTQREGYRIQLVKDDEKREIEMVMP